MASSFSKTTFNNLGTAPAIDATFLNTLQDFLVAIASGGSGSVVKADLADVATDADNADAVSAAGIGVTSIPAMASTADNYKTGGIFYCSSAITNAPFYGVKNANILVAPKDSNNVTQFAMSVDGSKAIKMRQCTGGTWTSWSDVGGGGSGAVNFLMNKLSENDLSSITNTGCTVTWDTTEDLSVAGSLKIDVAASGTGRKVEIDLSELSDAQITELCRLSFFYKLTVGADDNVEVYLLNGSDKFYFDIPFLAANAGTLTKFDAAGMVTNRTGNKLVFGFKDNSATTIYLGDALLTPRVLPQGAVISEWQSYTPTFQGFGTVTGVDCRWRRVGSSIEITGKFAPGTSTGDEGQIGLPSGLSIKSDLDSVRVVGVGGRSTWVRAETFLILATAGDTYLNVGVSSSIGVAVLAPIAGTNVVSSGYFSFTAFVPIEGWTSSINLVTEAQECASNSSTTNADDLTSFVYGDAGSPVPTLDMTAPYRTKRVRFKSPIGARDNFIIEILPYTASKWIPLKQTIPCSGGHYCSPFNYATSYSGIGWAPVASSLYDIDIIFGVKASDTGTSWANLTSVGTKYRVRKISNGNMAEAPASGIYESGSNANGYFVKYVDGTMVQWMKGLTVTNTGASTGSITATLPTPFADTNYSGLATKVGGSAAAFGYLGTKTTTTVIVGGQQKDSSTLGTIYVDVVLFGKWNLSRSVAAPGTPVGASTVFAHYRQSSAYAVGSLQPYNYDELIEDSLGCVTIGSSWKFTAPVSGLYLVTATIPTGASTYSALYKNGALAQQFGVFGSNTAMNAFPVSAVIRLAQGDYIDMRSTYTGSISSPDRFIQITRLSA